jgi:hypothetical protein
MPTRNRLERKTRRPMRKLITSLTPQPKPYTPGYHLTRKFRFLSTGPNTSVVTNLDICNAVGMMATSGTVAWPFCQAARIVQIEIWQAATNASASVPEAPTLVWSGNIFGPQVTVVNNSITPEQVTYLKSKPPRNGSGAFWSEQSASAVTVFSLSAGENCLVDITLEVVFYNGTLTSSAVDVSGLSGLTTGQIYFPALDGTTGTLQPVAGATL